MTCLFLSLKIHKEQKKKNRQILWAANGEYERLKQFLEL